MPGKQMNKDDFKSLLKGLGFTQSESCIENSEIYFDNELYGGFWVMFWDYPYYAHDCPYIHDVIGNQIYFADFIKKLVKERYLELVGGK